MCCGARGARCVIRSAGESTRLTVVLKLHRCRTIVNAAHAVFGRAVVKIRATERAGYCYMDAALERVISFRGGLLAK